MGNDGDFLPLRLELDPLSDLHSILLQTIKQDAPLRCTCKCHLDGEEKINTILEGGAFLMI